MPTVVNAENYKDKRQNIITNYFDTNKKKKTILGLYQGIKIINGLTVKWIGHILSIMYKSSM